MDKKTIVTGGAGASMLGLALAMATPQIVSSEGQRALAYKDVIGKLTVCSGHTGKDIVVGKVYSPDECKKLTTADAKVAADGILKVSPHLVWHPMQLAAAISFSYNVGTGTYAKSSIARLFNRGDFVGGCNALTLYNKAGGRIYSGLVTRRAQELKLCLSTLTPGGLIDVS